MQLQLQQLHTDECNNFKDCIINDITTPITTTEVPENSFNLETEPSSTFVYDALVEFKRFVCGKLAEQKSTILERELNNKQIIIEPKIPDVTY